MALINCPECAKEVSDSSSKLEWENYNIESKQKLSEHSTVTKKYKLKLKDGRVVTGTFKNGQFHSIFHYEDLNTGERIHEPAICDDQISMFCSM